MLALQQKLSFKLMRLSYVANKVIFAEGNLIQPCL